VALTIAGYALPAAASDTLSADPYYQHEPDPVGSVTASTICARARTLNNDGEFDPIDNLHKEFDLTRDAAAAADSPAIRAFGRSLFNEYRTGTYKTGDFSRAEIALGSYCQR
jgi:hypothetical protein